MQLVARVLKMFSLLEILKLFPKVVYRRYTTKKKLLNKNLIVLEILQHTRNGDLVQEIYLKMDLQEKPEGALQTCRLRTVRLKLFPIKDSTITFTYTGEIVGKTEIFRGINNGALLAILEDYNGKKITFNRQCCWQ